MPVLNGRRQAGEAVLGATQPVAAILSGSWRAEPEPARLPATSLEAALPVLTSTGASGLAWNRIKRNPDLAASTAGAELREQARMLVLDMARHETALRDLFQLLKDSGIEPLLFKGWAMAQHYAEPHLRPMGDVDLCVPPGRFDEAAALLRDHGFLDLTAGGDEAQGRTVLLAAPAGWRGCRLLVDLHESLDRFRLGPPEDVFARARSSCLGGESVLVPAAEDHLRLVAMHFLHDGGWRPLSLCDVAALVERLPSSFDWDLCLGGDGRRRRWIACTLELTRELLGARLDAMPDAYRAADPPRWLGETVLRAWRKPFSHHRARVRIGSILRRHQSQLLAETRARWPNPIRASTELDADFTRMPRWPYQLWFFARAMGRFALRARRHAPAGDPTD